MAKGLEPLRCRTQPIWPTDIRNASMAELDQVAYRFSYSHRIINREIAHPLSRRSKIEENNRNLPTREFIDDGKIEFRRHERDFGHLSFDQSTNIMRRAVRVVLRVQQNHVVAALKRDVLNTLG